MNQGNAERSDKRLGVGRRGKYLFKYPPSRGDWEIRG